MPDTDGQFELDGGRLCLDFANTLSPFSADRLRSPADLVAFARQAEILPAAEAVRLQAEVADRPADAQAFLERARALRLALFHVFSAVAARQPVPAADLDALNRELATTLAHQCVVVEPDGGFSWGWLGGQYQLTHLLFPIVRSAADLLTSDDRQNVRQCAAPDCAWLFVDTSRNRSRQWCSMQTCGNRAKARRFYERRKCSSAAAAGRAVSAPAGAPAPRPAPAARSAAAPAAAASARAASAAGAATRSAGAAPSAAPAARRRPGS
jgi:predicted RNA-binding Zn ribbon-like protein